MKRLACIVGARPNFVKMAPILEALKRIDGVRPVLIHSGQHYDERLSDVFFSDLKIRKPDHVMDVRAETNHQQITNAACQYSNFIARSKMDATLVVGDVNTTLGCAMGSARMRVPVIHIEAGLRSFDWSMPEEFNRVATDNLSRLLLASEPSGIENLRKEGRHDGKLVGNVMIDSLLRFVPHMRQDGDLGFFAFWTMHRPDNVDRKSALAHWVDVMCAVADKKLPVVFSMHPRTQNRLESFGLAGKLDACQHITAIPPVGYLECIRLASQAKVIITDSGGLQEEATALNVPCITLRNNTERPITLTHGTNHLVGENGWLVLKLVSKALQGEIKQAKPIPLWDGHAAERVAAEIQTFLRL